MKLPKIIIVIQGTEARALVDSGASSSFISTNFLEKIKFNLVIKKVQPIVVRCANDTTMSCTELVTLNIQVTGGDLNNFDFFCIPGPWPRRNHRQ